MTFEPPPSAGAQAPVEPPPSPEPVSAPPADQDAATTRDRRPTRGPGPRRAARITALAIVVVLAGSAMFFSGWTLGQQALLTSGTPPDVAEAFQPFWDAYYAIVERYAGGPVDQQALVQGAIRGMFDAVGDPFSRYLSPSDFQRSLETIAGQFEGIGATIGTVDAAGNTTTCDALGPDCQLAIVDPIPGSPAEQDGLLPGDVVTLIDGRSVAGLTVNAARDLIRGSRGTTVTLTVVRDGSTPFEVPIVRAVIVQSEVSAKDLADGTVGYIKLSAFSDNASAQFDAALASDIEGGKHRLVLDLRGNGGGYITAARHVASQFLAGGTIFWQEDAEGTLTETTASPGGVATDPSIRLVVLVDGGTASASEIVAGALQDRGRAVLVGTTTFGKGTIQQWTQLEGNNGGFRLTVAKWLTPDKTWINKVGLTPDVAVNTAPARPGDDPVLDRALQILAAPAANADLLAAA